MNTLLLVPLDKWHCLRVVNHETLLDGLLIIVGTAALLTTQNEALHQLVLGNIKLNHSSNLVATLVEHLLQGLGLWDGAGETVEDNTLAITSEAIVNRSENAYHQIVGDQLSLLDIAGSSLTQLGTILNFTTKYITS